MPSPSSLQSVALRGSTQSGLGLSRMVLQRELIGCCLSVSPLCWMNPGWLRLYGVKYLVPWSMCETELIGCCLSVSPLCWMNPGWLRLYGVKYLVPWSMCETDALQAPAPVPHDVPARPPLPVAPPRPPSPIGIGATLPRCTRCSQH